MFRFKIVDDFTTVKLARCVQIRGSTECDGWPVACTKGLFLSLLVAKTFEAVMSLDSFLIDKTSKVIESTNCVTIELPEGVAVQ